MQVNFQPKKFSYGSPYCEASAEVTKSSKIVFQCAKDNYSK